MEIDLEMSCQVVYVQEQHTKSNLVDYQVKGVVMIWNKHMNQRSIYETYVMLSTTHSLALKWHYCSAHVSVPVHVCTPFLFFIKATCWFKTQNCNTLYGIPFHLQRDWIDYRERNNFLCTNGAGELCPSSAPPLLYYISLNDLSLSLY